MVQLIDLEEIPDPVVPPGPRVHEENALLGWRNQGVDGPNENVSILMQDEEEEEDEVNRSTSSAGPALVRLRRTTITITVDDSTSVAAPEAPVRSTRHPNPNYRVRFKFVSYVN